MTAPTSDIAFTAAVKSQQEKMGSRSGYARMEEKGGWSDRVSADLREFLAERDAFYFGTASADGRPYIQYRGGPKGLLKVVDDQTLAFADFSGNRQYISIGNLSENNQAYLFLMDYPNRRRFKIWGRARVVDDDAALLQALSDPEYRAAPERAIVFDIEAWDRNCPQHIHQRFTEEEMAPVIEQLTDRIDALSKKVEELQAELASR